MNCFFSLTTSRMIPLALSFAAAMNVAAALVWPGVAKASVEVKLSEPHWEFLLRSQPLTPTEAQLEPQERAFARTVQPMLSTKDYHGVAKAFEQRDIAKDSAALRLLRGQIMLSLKNLSAAQHALEAALTTMPDLALAHQSLSMVYLMKKQYAKARHHLQRTIELGIADAQTYGQLAFVNLQTSHPASAVAGYQQALYLEPDNRQWQQGLLYALTNSHASNQAQALVEEMLADDGDNAELWLLRGQLALQQKQHDIALSSLEVALHLGEKSVENLTLTAQLHLQSGSSVRAVSLIISALKNTPKHQQKKRWESVDQAAAWLIHQQDWNAVSRLLESVSAASLPTPYQARFDAYRAQYALAKGHTKQAKRQLLAALRNDPTMGNALMTLGDIYTSQQQYDNAEIYYVRAQALADYKERALLSRAQIHINREHYSDALKLLRQVVQDNPNRGDIVANIRALTQLVRHQE